MQRAADCTAVSSEVDGYTGKESREGEVHRAIWKEEGCRPIVSAKEESFFGRLSEAGNEDDRHDMPEKQKKRKRAQK